MLIATTLRRARCHNCGDVILLVDTRTERGAKAVQWVHAELPAESCPAVPTDIE